jgi:cell division transport system ATP-binding protein
MNVFRDFNRVGVTTLIASHDQDLMARYATRTLRIDPGKFADSQGSATPQPEAGAGQSGIGQQPGAASGRAYPGESA